MPKSWDPSIIRELLARASLCGVARADLGSPDEASLFRFAIYNFRKTHHLGLDLRITLSDNSVLIEKQQIPAIHIVQ